MKRTKKRLVGILLSVSMLFAAAAPSYAAEDAHEEHGVCEHTVATSAFETADTSASEAGCGASIVSLGTLSGWGPACTTPGCISGTKYEVFDCSNLCRSPGYSGYILRCNKCGIIEQNGQVMGRC